MTNEEFMNLGIEQATKTMRLGIGGPFGAVVVKDGKIVAVASNSVLRDNDPTCHAEINAIREACKVLGTYDLSGCELYATGFPCPMCLSAIMWANIKKVYVSGKVEDAAKIGFRDGFIYNFIYGNLSDKSTLDIIQMDNLPAINLYSEYQDQNNQMY